MKLEEMRAMRAGTVHDMRGLNPRVFDRVFDEIARYEV